MAESESVPFWWIVLFLLLALGAAGIAVVLSGGTLVQSGAVLLPFLF